MFWLQVLPKRTNMPGISSTDRGFMRGGRFRGRGVRASRFHNGFQGRFRGFIRSVLHTSHWSLRCRIFFIYLSIALHVSFSEVMPQILIYIVILFKDFFQFVSYTVIKRNSWTKSDIYMMVIWNVFNQRCLVSDCNGGWAAMFASLPTANTKPNLAEKLHFNR